MNVPLEFGTYRGTDPRGRLASPWLYTHLPTYLNYDVATDTNDDSKFEDVGWNHFRVRWVLIELLALG